MAPPIMAQATPTPVIPSKPPKEPHKDTSKKQSKPLPSVPVPPPPGSSEPKPPAQQAKIASGSKKPTAEVPPQKPEKPPTSQPAVPATKQEPDTKPTDVKPDVQTQPSTSAAPSNPGQAPADTSTLPTAQPVRPYQSSGTSPVKNNALPHLKAGKKEPGGQGVPEWMGPDGQASPVVGLLQRQPKPRPVFASTLAAARPAAPTDPSTSNVEKPSEAGGDPASTTPPTKADVIPSGNGTSNPQQQ
eukprot:scaffold71398_cov35-Prasinocladus_malaysianus.AAC.5